MNTNKQSIRETLGQLAGAVLAPGFALGSWLRQARFFHPEGVCYQAQVAPAAHGAAEDQLAQRLSGKALVRFSGAWWRRGKEWPDVLGVALRFGVTNPRKPTQGDQDLLFATIPLFWMTPLAPLWTRTHDFLDNTYFAVSPFQAHGIGRLKWRLRPEATSPQGADRYQRLEQAVRNGKARLVLEASMLEGDAAWKPVAEIQLTEKLDLDQETLRFSPFNAGQGIEPRGFIHALRMATYGLSQKARPRTEEEADPRQLHPQPANRPAPTR